MNAEMFSAVLKELETLKDRVARLENTPPPALMPVASQSPWLNAHESAAYLGVSVKALYHLVDRKKLPKRSKPYRYSREELDAFVRQTD